MNFITQIISEELTYALGNTLLHSIWQGAAVALILAIIRLGMRRFSSTNKYIIAVSALVLVFSLSIFTFMNSFQTKTSLKFELLQSNSEETFIPQSSELKIEKNYDNKANNIQHGFSSIINYLHKYLPSIVAIWLVGLLFQTLKFTGGFIYNRRLTLHKTKKISPDWQEIFKALCQKTRITQAVRMIESSLVKTPIVIGHLKPVILMPIGLLSQLPQNQIEAIIIHELAHIRRRDYLLNLVQSLIDVLFFYHPAVKWISSIVSEERENCCDDIAINISGDKLNFARALVNIQSQQVDSLNYAVAAIGKHGKLFQRISRLFSHPHNNSGLTEKLISTVIIVLCFITVVAHSQSYFYKQDLKTNIAVMPLLPEIQMLQGAPNSANDSTRTENINNNLSNQLVDNRTITTDNKNNKIIKRKDVIKNANKNQNKEEIIQIKAQTDNQVMLIFPAQKNGYVSIRCAEKKVKELHLDNIRIYDWEVDNYWLIMNKFIKPHFDYMKTQDKFKKYHPILKAEYAKTKERFEKSLAHKKLFSKEFQELDEKSRDTDEDFEKFKEYEIRHLEEEREKLIDEVEEVEVIERMKDEEEILRARQNIEEEFRRELDKTEDIEKEYENQRKHEERQIILREKIRKIEEQLQEQHHEMEENSGQQLQSMKHELQEMEKQIRQENSIRKRRRLEIEEDLRRDTRDMERRIRDVRKKISDINEEYLVNELLKDGLIKNEDDYSFEMTNKYLKINKKKQPKEIYEKYKEIVKSRYGVKFKGKLKFIISTR